MTKKIIFLFLFLGYVGYAQEYKMVSEELKGKIKSVEIAVVTEGGKKIPLEIKNYDTKGRVLSFKTFYDGRIQTNERSTYHNNSIITDFCDNCGDLDKAFANFAIKENQKNPYSGYATDDPSRTFKTFKTIDKNGNVIDLKVYNHKGYLSWSTKSTFDKNANLLLEESFDDDGKKMPSYKSKKYNNKGLIEEDFTFTNHYETKSIYTYNNLGQKIAEKVVQGSRTTEYFYEYLTEKDTIKILSYYKNTIDGTKILRKQKLIFTENEKKIEKEVDLNNVKITAIRFFEFDKNDNLVLKKEYNDKNELRSEIKLVYDKKNNWTEMEYSYLVHASYNGSDPKPEWRTKKFLRTINYY